MYFKEKFSIEFKDNGKSKNAKKRQVSLKIGIKSQKDSNKMYFVLTKNKILSSIAIFVAVILCSVVLSGNGSYAVFYNSNLRKLPIYSVQTDEKKVAISFDCAWGVDYTDKLLATMKTYNVRCTFFTVEFWAKKHPDYLQKISEMGHEIGTHSATHPYMSKLSKDAIVNELTTSIQAIEQVVNKKVQLFRPPYGDYDDLLIETAKEMGLYTIQWSVDSLDWKDLSATEITNRVLKRVKNGSIVLFHNQGLHTSEALPTIIESLQQSGYTFVPISELIYKENYTIGSDGTQRQNN